MDWTKGYMSAYYAMKINPQTWQDEERIDITDGSVSQSASGMRQSADLTVSNGLDRETYVRVYLLATQGNDKVREPLFTGLAVSPSRDLNGIVETYKLECYSVLKPCNDIYLPRGWYAPAGVSCENMIRTLLSATPAPKEIPRDGVPSLTEAIVAEEDETNLSMVDKMLNAIGWEMVIDGNGRIVVRQPNVSIATTFGFDNADILEQQISVEDDWFDAPNVFRAISDDLVAVARDDTSDTPLSVEGRGREVWMQDTSVNLGTNESIEEFATRRLKEEQNRKRTVSYKRRFEPNVRLGDIIRLHYPAQGINGVYHIVSQTTQFAHNCQTSEKAEEL